MEERDKIWGGVIELPGGAGVETLSNLAPRSALSAMR
jgi:hypothetical protein